MWGHRTIGVLAVAVLLAATGATQVSAAALHPAEAWPQFMYGPGHRSFNSADHAITYANVSRLRLRFRVQLGRTSNPFNLGTSTAAARGVVYTTSGNGRLNAVDASTGRRIWSRNVGCCFPSGPAVSGNAVYVQGDDGTVDAFDARTGTALWTDKVTLLTGGYVSQPTVVGSTVYVLTEDGYLDALRAADGSVIWSQFFPQGSFFSAPAVYDGVLYAGLGKTLVAVDAADGHTIWTATLDDFAWSSPSVHLTRVFVISRSGTVYALDRETGTIAWQADTGGLINASSPAVAYGRVYAANLNGDVFAYDEATGALDWHANIAAAIVGSPAIAGGLVFLSSEGTTLAVLSAHTGALRFSRLAGPSDSSPTVVGNAVFVASGNNRLNAYAIPTGPHSPSR